MSRTKLRFSVVALIAFSLLLSMIGYPSSFCLSYSTTTTSTTTSWQVRSPYSGTKTQRRRMGTTTSFQMHSSAGLQPRRSRRVKISTRAPTTTTTTTSLWALPRSLISADDAWGNWAVLSGLAAASQSIGQHTTIGRLLGPPVTAMALAFVAATIGILHPGGTAAAKSLQLLSLQFATPLILLGADLRDAVARCGPLLLSFTVAAMATIVACGVGWTLTGSMLTRSLGPHDGLVIAAALLAKNVGGGINYLAVCRSLNASPAAVAAGICVDNIFALAYFPVTSALASGRPDVVVTAVHPPKKKLLEVVKKSNDDDDNSYEVVELEAEEEETLSPPATVQTISTVLFLSTVLLWMGEKIGGDAGALPVCTVLSVLLASVAPSSFMEPLRTSANHLGLVMLYLFFATAGAPGVAVAESVQASLLPVGLFLSCLYSIHGTILYIAHRLLGTNTHIGGAFQPQRLLVSSSAAIGGPATAVALATAANWKSLAVPSIVVGNIGYAIATFCGLAFHAFFNHRR